MGNRLRLDCGVLDGHGLWGVLHRREKTEEKRAREYWYEKLRELSPAGRTEDLCRWVKDHRGEIPGLQRLFARDSHPWEKKRQRSGEGCRGTAREELGYLRELEETALWWKRIRGQTGLPSGQGRRKRGTAAGSESRALEPGRRKVYDYRRFLKRYAVFREEMQLDPDSFDYLPYTYSREHYDKLVLLEPLETTEVHRLEELVIAIDTSGSCSRESGPAFYGGDLRNSEPSGEFFPEDARGGDSV